MNEHDEHGEGKSFEQMQEIPRPGRTASTLLAFAASLGFDFEPESPKLEDLVRDAPKGDERVKRKPSPKARARARAARKARKKNRR